jgi:hypothetical protein
MKNSKEKVAKAVIQIIANNINRTLHLETTTGIFCKISSMETNNLV